MPPANLSEKTKKRKGVRSLYLHDGEAHTVWKPIQLSETTPSTKFFNVVREAMARKNELYERQKNLESRIQATRNVLKMKKDELVTIVEEEVEEEGNVTEQEGLNTSHTSTEIKQKSQQATTKEEEELDSKIPKRMRKMSLFPLQIHNMVSQYAAQSPHASPFQLPPFVEAQDGDKNQENVTWRKKVRRVSSVATVSKRKRNADTVTPPRKRRLSQPETIQEKLKRVQTQTMV